MKQLMLSITLLCASAPAMASKARLMSLQGANHIVDTQTVFTNPAHLNYLGQYITFEMGTPGTAAEGGFARKLNSGARLSAYLGHRDPLNTFATADVRIANGYIGQNNPLEVTYAQNDMGFGVSVSNLDDKKAGTKETTLVGKFGMKSGNTEFFTHLHLISQAEKTAGGNKDKISAPQLVIGGAIDVDTIRYYGSLQYGQAKNEPGAPAAPSVTIKDLNAVLAFEDRSMKTQENDIYYGAQLNYVSRDVGGAKITGTQLPVFLGMELNATSWAVFRGSVSQNLILGSVKDETAVNKDAAGISNNTTVTAGLGLKYNNLVLDGALSAASNGNINGNAFLTSAAVTYTF
ncbi:hypothetical protein [Pseudobdellovibrio exovorus]|uniref:Uncharacterized protein n=1 Tax=Pseudobdellovibrio exovorus JSS TaxID=1184267 RepID=M4V8D9_9BACT|nr:hypothetical protein [Pseudobdellovibrio exovorus]AGH95657.1 hypothetical protein A11Q_1441 [Pseudobdellovibrio exovorus JSS]